MKIFFIFVFLLPFFTSSLPSSTTSQFQIHLSYTGTENSISIIFSTPSLSTLNDQYYIEYTYELNNEINEPIIFDQKIYSKKKRLEFIEDKYDMMIHEVIIDHIEYDQMIYYRIRNENDIKKDMWYYESDIYNFIMIDENQKDYFDFIVFGDGNGDDFEVVIKNIAKYDLLKNRFVLHTGDIGFSPPEQEFDKNLQRMEKVSRYVPVHVTAGNHEKNNNFKAFKEKFTSSLANNSGSTSVLYYSFDYGNIHIINLMTASDDFPYGKTSEQYKWLENDLKNVDRKKYPFIIAFFHKPMYSSNTRHLSEMNIRQSFEGLFSKYRVSVVFNGHVHAYERCCESYNDQCLTTHPDEYYLNDESIGTIHIVVGTGGRRKHSLWTKKTPWTIKRFTEFGYLQMRSYFGSQPYLKGTFYQVINENDRIIKDEFTIYYNLTKPIPLYCYNKIFNDTRVCGGNGFCHSTKDERYYCDCENFHFGVKCESNGYVVLAGGLLIPLIVLVVIYLICVFYFAERGGKDDDYLILNNEVDNIKINIKKL